MSPRFACFLSGIATLLSLFFSCAELPVDPMLNPSNASVELFLKDGGDQVADYGTRREIGIALKLTNLLDTVRITSGCGNVDTLFPADSADIYDTVWINPLFDEEGQCIISAEATMRNGDLKNKTHSLSIHVLAPKPGIHFVEIPSAVTMSVGGLDSLRYLTRITGGAAIPAYTCAVVPESGGEFFTAEYSAQKDSVIVIASPLVAGEYEIELVATSSYNEDILTDTAKVTVTVSERTGNAAPQWNVDVLPVNMHVTSLCTLVLDNLCNDPDGDELTYALVEGEPSGDEITDGIYRFASGESAGSYSVKIAVVDPTGENDTLLVELTVDASVTDNTAPSITVISPSENTTVSTATVEVDVICSDASGIKSVVASIGESDVELQEQDGHYKGNVGLTAGNNTITVKAIDASPAENAESTQVSVMYSQAYTVTYICNDKSSGEVPTDENGYGEGSTVIVKENTGSLSRDGFTFAGWSTQEDGNGKVYTSGDTLQMGNGNVTFYATWTETATYTLNVSAENGSITRSPDLSEYSSGTVVTLTPVPAEDYHFTGWGGALSGSEKPARITMDSDKSVTAQFEANLPNTFSLTVHSTNGKVTRTPDLEQYTSGSSVSLKAIPNTGYRFVGWSDDATGTIDETTVVMNGAKTVSANFELKSYTLTVSKSGNGTTEPSNTSNVNHGAATSLKATASTGYEFVNWTTDDAAATIANPSSATAATVTLTGNATVTANFKVKSYTLTVTNDGNGTTNPSSSTNVNHGVATSLRATASTGYEFVNWTTSDAAASIVNASSATAATVTLTGNAAIKANFKKQAFVVKFDSQGGSPNPLQKTVEYNSLLVEPTQPVMEGYDFRGWYTEPGYVNIWTFGSDKVTKAMTLYAKWTIKKYDVIFHPQGGSPTPTVQSVNHGGLVVESTGQNAPELTSYELEGWYTEPAYNNKWTFGTQVFKDYDLYAKWVIRDVDGNTYSEVTINGKVWMVENLKTTQYNDKTPITEIANQTDWDDQTTTQAAYCWYSKNPSTKEPYGALYNWNAVNSGKLAPKGWHVATFEDWSSLLRTDYCQLMEYGTSHWDQSCGNNESGFTAVGGGGRTTTFSGLKTSASFWTTQKVADGLATMAWINYSAGATTYASMKNGCSVRCVKD